MGGIMMLWKGKYKQIGWGEEMDYTAQADIAVAAALKENRDE